MTPGSAGASSTGLPACLRQPTRSPSSGRASATRPRSGRPPGHAGVDQDRTARRPPRRSRTTPRRPRRPARAPPAGAASGPGRRRPGVPSGSPGATGWTPGTYWKNRCCRPSCTSPPTGSSSRTRRRRHVQPRSRLAFIPVLPPRRAVRVPVHSPAAVRFGRVLRHRPPRRPRPPARSAAAARGRGQEQGEHGADRGEHPARRMRPVAAGEPAEDRGRTAGTAARTGCRRRRTRRPGWWTARRRAAAGRRGSDDREEQRSPVWAATTTSEPAAGGQDEPASRRARRRARAQARARWRCSLLARYPPRPRVATRAAQYGPKAAAGASSATSHNGPNSKTACDSIAGSAASRMTFGPRGCGSWPEGRGDVPAQRDRLGGAVQAGLVEAQERDDGQRARTAR